MGDVKTPLEKALSANLTTFWDVVQTLGTKVALELTLAALHIVKSLYVIYEALFLSLCFLFVKLSLVSLRASFQDHK